MPQQHAMWRDKYKSCIKWQKSFEFFIKNSNKKREKSKLENKLEKSNSAQILALLLFSLFSPLLLWNLCKIGKKFGLFRLCFGFLYFFRFCSLFWTFFRLRNSSNASPIAFEHSNARMQFYVNFFRSWSQLVWRRHLDTSKWIAVLIAVAAMKAAKTADQQSRAEQKEIFFGLFLLFRFFILFSVFSTFS